MKKRVLLIGSAKTDFEIRVPELADCKEVFGDMDYTCAPGGSVSVGGVAVTRLGGDAILCGCLGDDQYGKDMLAFYRDMGMDTRFINTVKGSSTPLRIHITSENGDAETYTSTSLCDSVTPDMVEDAFTSMPDAVYINLEISADAAVRAAELAREKKIPAFFDGEFLPEDFPLEELGAVDLIALGTDAAKRLTGISPKSAQSTLEAAVELAKTLRAKTYIFKFGTGGAFAYKGNFSYYIPYTEGADKRLNELFVPSMILENLRSAKSVRSARYASTVISLAAKKNKEIITSVPTEVEVLKYILEYEVEL